jgi:hypothetical protein
MLVETALDRACNFAVENRWCRRWFSPFLHPGDTLSLFAAFLHPEDFKRVMAASQSRAELNDE